MSARSRKVQLTKRDIEDGLRLLASLGAASGLSANIYVVGGAVLALADLRETTTVDVDTRISATAKMASALLDLAAQVAAARGWQSDWFNCAAEMFVPTEGEPYEWTLYLDGPISVYLAPLEMILVMKLRSDRPRDLVDVPGLIDRCQISSVEEIEALFDRYFPHDGPSPRPLDWIQENLRRNPAAAEQAWRPSTRDPNDTWVDTHIDVVTGELVDGHWTSERGDRELARKIRMRTEPDVAGE